MKRLCFWALCLILIASLAAGCAPQQDQSGAPQTTQGGTATDAKNINIKDIDILKQDENTVVTFSLLSGSRKAGYAESKLTQLPAYQIEMLDQPQRLKIKFDNISFWDYEPKDSWMESDTIQGLFREVPANNSSLIMFIQLTRSASFDVKEDEGNLVLTIKPGNENTDTKYYCTANAFYEHQEGRWPEAVDMQPVLCSDLQNKLLISHPFDTKEEAQAFMQNIEKPVKDALPEAALTVVGIGKNALPDFSSDIDYSFLENRGVLMKDGSFLNTSVLLDNGRYLDTAPDGRVVFSRAYKPEEPSMQQDNYLMSERLWIQGADGRANIIDVSEFFLITKAKFSPDGRYLAILDSSIENSVLYVYDFTNTVLINLGEEGFGSQTTDFAWSDVGSTLYAMTGNSDTKQMRSCTFGADGSIQIQAVEELEGAEGSVAVRNGRVYFADKTTGRVYEIGETRRDLTGGVDICARSDSNQLLVLETQPSADEQVPTSLKLFNLDTGETVMITNGTDIVDFGFMPGGKVYFLDAKIADAAEGFPYGLFVYDIAGGTLQEIAVCGTDEFATSDSGVLYFIDYLGEVENGFYATFTYNLS